MPPPIATAAPRLEPHELTDTAWPKLYMIVETGAGAAERLAVAMATAPLACLLVVPRSARPASEVETRAVVKAAQAESVAALVLGDAALARRTGADGVHVPAGEAPLASYRRARAALGEAAIVGVEVTSRHDAMEVGEAGADYVAFAAPPEGERSEPARAWRWAMIDWWAEFFEPPCVAMNIEQAEEAAALAAAGADFIAVPLPTAATLDATRARVASVWTAVRAEMREN